MKIVTIPSCMDPFVVNINGVVYSYSAGATVEVPDHVAEVIENHTRQGHPEPTPPKPAYVKTVNGVKPDEEGNVEVDSDAVADDVIYGTETHTEIVELTLTIVPGRVKRDGVIDTNAGKMTEPFTVNSGDKYLISTTYGRYFPMVTEYDENDNFLGMYPRDLSNVEPLGETVTDHAYIVPDGVAKIVVSDMNGYTNPVVKQENKITANVSVKEKVEEHETKISNISSDVAHHTKKIIKANTDIDCRVENRFTYDYNSTIAIIIELLKKGTYSEDVAARIEALENSVYSNVLKLPTGIGVGTYTLKYEDDSGVMADWLDICTFTLSSAGQTIAYTGFIEENVAPKTATKIGVYDSDNTRVSEIALGWLKRFFSGWTPTYTFAAVSDTHVGEDGADADFTDAVEYFGDNVDFAVVCGDCVDDATETTQLATYQSIVADAQTPIYVITGNHEAVNMDVSGANVDISGNYASISQYFAQTAHPNINQELYYSFEKNGDVFIMVGAYGNYNYDRTFSAEELQWLYETLEVNRNKRCFLFHHYFPKNGSGDAINCYATNDGLKGTQGEVFYSLLRHYKNVIYFHGHSHEKFNAQELNRYNTIDKEYGMFSVHIPSLTKPKDPNATQSSLLPDTEAGEGYIVDVYSTAVHLKGRDFEQGKFSPVGSYWLLTTLQTIEAGTYYDPTGTIDT